MNISLAVYKTHLDMEPLFVDNVEFKNEVSQAAHWLQHGAALVYAFASEEQLEKKEHRVYTRSWMRDNFWNLPKVH